MYIEGVQHTTYQFMYIVKHSPSQASEYPLLELQRFRM